MGNYEKLPCFNSTSVRLNAVGYTYSRHEPQFQFYISTIKYSQAIFGLMIDKFQFYISTIKCLLETKEREFDHVSILHQYD